MSYDRYLDVLVTGSNGWYDFVHAINDQSAYMTNKMATGGAAGADLALTGLPNALKGVITARNAKLPATGYVATSIAINEISNRTVRAETQRLVQWVSNGNSTGKIRINCHGDPNGSLMFMNTNSAGTAKEVCHFFLIADWLQANGLVSVNFRGLKKRAGKKHGLSTINLAVCHSARRRVPTALAIGMVESGVEQVSQRLNTLGYNSISVTGHDQAFSIVPGEHARNLLAAESASVAVDSMKGPNTNDSLWDETLVSMVTARGVVLQLINGLQLPPLQKTGLLQQINGGILARDALKQVAVTAMTAVAKDHVDADFQGLSAGQTTVSGGLQKQRFAKLPSKVRQSS